MSLEPNQHRNNSSDSRVSEKTTALAKILIIFGIILIWGLVVDLCTPKCVYSGCDNDRKEGSIFCYLHD